MSANDVYNISLYLCDNKRLIDLVNYPFCHYQYLICSDIYINFYALSNSKKNDILKNDYNLYHDILSRITNNQTQRFTSRTQSVPKVRKHDGFIFVLGNHEWLPVPKSISRIYFNINFCGAAIISEKLAQYFDYVNIPYRFKCLQDRKYYKRRDALVIYVLKKHVHLATQIISEFYSDVSSYFDHDKIPFAKEIGPGIFFAENPFDNESFGYNRCNLIANTYCSIIKTITKDVRVNDLFDAISYQIDCSGLILDKLYLEQGSRYPYEFSKII